MKKQVKLFLPLLMAALMVFNCVAFVGAEGTAARTNVVSPRFVAIWDCGNLLSLENSLGKLYCGAYTDTYFDYYAETIVELQEKDGSSWSTIKTWSDSTGSSGSEVAEYYYVAHGTYQLKVTHRAYNTDYTLADEFISYSDIVTY